METDASETGNTTHSSESVDPDDQSKTIADGETKGSAPSSEDSKLADNSQSADDWEMELLPPPPSFDVTLYRDKAKIKELSFSKEVVVIGRENNVDIKLNSKLVSRRHCEIRRHDKMFALIDYKTHNGCYVNRKRVESLVILNDKDEIIVGKFRLLFRSKSAQTFDVPDMQKPEGAKPGIEELGGATLQISTRTTRRMTQEYNRVRGYAVLPQNARVFIAEVFQIGKSADCDLRLNRMFVPRKAALITRGMNEYRIYNVAPNVKHVKVNGLIVGNQKILRDRDLIVVCKFRFRFSIPPLEAK
jgi:pSer/pThr/pTyr-binding forkhead associated (FHA) protein